MMYFLLQIVTFGVTDGFISVIKTRTRILFKRPFKKGDESENLYF